MSLVEELVTGTGQDWDDDGSLTAWLSGAGAMMQPVVDLIRDGADPGWSSILDVDRCPAYALPWLAQLIGVRLDPSLSEADQRTAIRAEDGFGRGTVARLESAAKPFLIGTQTVIIAERDTSPYHLTVGVYSDELNLVRYNQLSALYPTYADLAGAFATYDAFSFSLAALTAALLAVKPAGLQLVLDVIERSWPDGLLFPALTLYPGG